MCICKTVSIFATEQCQHFRNTFFHQIKQKRMFLSNNSEIQSYLQTKTDKQIFAFD